jgi:hypothetical protein
MLRIKIFVNLKKIDEIRIWNTDKKTKSGRYIYEIIRPKKYRGKRIYHYRKDGWQVLAKKVLEVITKK